MFFKTSTLIALLSFIHISVLAQQPLTANAGPDIFGCADDSAFWANAFLGGAPTATGGTPPYTYNWSFWHKLFPWSDIQIHGSDILSDTTIANPQIFSISNTNDLNVPYIKLTVTDAQGNIAEDSLRVVVSSFAYLIANYYTVINQGDTALLPLASDVFEGIPPLTYSWSPNDHIIIDSINGNIIAFPDTTTYYQVSVTDSIGCGTTGSYDFLTLIVYPLSTNTLAQNNKIKVSPNPCSNELKVDIEANFASNNYRIYNQTGQVIQAGTLTNNTINTAHLAKGSYILVIESEGMPPHNALFVKQ